MKKWLGFLLSFTLTIGSVGLTAAPASAAQTCEGFAVGNGLYASPYEVANQADWQLFQTCLLTADNGARYISFKQTADFSVASLGNDAAAGRLGGYYDGNNHTITGISITEGAGLFAQLQGPGGITNLEIEGSVAGSGRTGGLVGYVFDNGRVHNVQSRVTVTSPSSAVGGLVGGINNGTISDSSASPAASETDLVVSSSRPTTVQGIGGLVGETFNASISNSYSTGRINVGDSPTLYIGGLVGSAHSQYHQILASYSTSDVYAPNSEHVGGLVGLLNGGSSIRNSYASGNVTGLNIVGGLVGKTISGTSIATSYASGLVTGLGASATVGGLVATSTGATTQFANTYWENGSPNLTTSFGQSVGITGAQWSTPGTFSGWNISNVGMPGYNWQICPTEENARPFLGWQITDCVYPPAAPSAPALTLSSVTDGTANFEITAPSFIGHSPITGYVIETSTNNIDWIPDANQTTALTRSVSGLTNGQLYYFRAVAKNIAFDSVASQTATAVTWDLPGEGDHAFERLAISEALGSSATGFTKFGDKVYFQANDQVHGTELWSWDEVGEPTLVADLADGSQDSYPGDFAVGGGYFFFTANDGTGKAIYKFDGIGAPEKITLTNSIPVNFWADMYLSYLNGKIYFAAYSSNQSKYFSLSLAETEAVPVLCSGASTDSFYIQDAVYLGSKIFLSGTDEAGALELFVNDGTSCSKAFDLGSNSQVSELATHDSKLYFSAASPAGDTEMWIYDGTNAPVMIDIDRDSTSSSNPNFSSSATSSNEAQTLNGKIIFSAYSRETGRELMTIDSAGVVTRLSDFYPGSSSGVVTMGITFDGAYYFGCEAVVLSGEVCRLDENGIQTLFQDLAPGAEGGYPHSFMATEKHLFLGTSSWQTPSEGYVLSTRAAYELESPGMGSTSQTLVALVAPTLPKFNNLVGMKINPLVGRLKLSGSGFANIKSVKIGDRVVNITKTGETEIEISYEQLTFGLNNLVLETNQGMVTFLDALFVSRPAAKRPAAKSVVCLAGYTSYFSEAAALARASLLCRRLKAAKPNLIAKVAVKASAKATLRAVYDTSR